MVFRQFFSKSLMLLGILGVSVACAHSAALVDTSKRRLGAPKAESSLHGQDPLERGQLVSYSLVGTHSKEDLQKRYNPRQLRVRNDVEIYRIVYRTVIPTRPEELTDASGVIVYPRNNSRSTPLPWLSLQHGTIAGDQEAPSEHLGYGLAEASQGFVTAIQDYIGFGSSRQLFHPYMVAQSYAQTGIDMLRAVRAFTRLQNQEVGPLFLRGYSEGGYATMALQKEIEEHHGEEFSLRASAPAAGPYDLVVTSKVLGAQQKASPVNLPFVVLSYDYWFRQDPPLWDLSLVLRRDSSEMFDLFDGRYTSEQLYGLLPHETLGLFQERFVQDVISDEPQTPEGKQLKIWLSQESLTNKGWSPKTPTRIYHCIDDTVVPVEAAQSAWNSFKEINPAAPVEAFLIASPDPEHPYDHGNCPVSLSSLIWLASFKDL